VSYLPTSTRYTISSSLAPTVVILSKVLHLEAKFCEDSGERKLLVAPVRPVAP